MRRCGFFAFALFLLTVTPAHGQPQRTREVLLLARRSGVVEVADSVTLATLGTIRVGAMANWVHALPDGTRLLVALTDPPESQNCCALYSLDLERHELHRLLFPVANAVLSSDGHQAFVQRGNVGIEMIDLLDNRKIGQIGVCGRAYLLPASPYRRWLFGVANWPPRSLDIFDLKTNQLVRSLTVPGRPQLNGVWLRGKFYLLGHEGGRGTLWSVTPESQALENGKPVDLRAMKGECRVRGSRSPLTPFLESPIAAGDRLLVWEAFGMKLDRRDCADPPSGGYYVVDPNTGAVTAHLAPTLYFMRLVASCDGRELYGIELGPKPYEGTVRLMRLDAKTGGILASRELSKAMDAVSLAFATLFDSALPRGEVRAVQAAPPAGAVCPLTKPVLDEPPKDPHADPLAFGEWYTNDHRTIWLPRLDWRAGSAEKAIWIRPARTPLDITGRRLDGSAPSLHYSFPQNESYGFQVMGMSFPTAGCWEVTAVAGSESLTFVAAVGPRN